MKAKATAVDEGVITDVFPDDVEETSLSRVSPQTLAKVGEVSGAFSSSDIVIPRLNLVQGVGPLSRIFKPGDWVLSKETCIASEGKDFRIIVLSITKYFVERLAKYDPNSPMPEVYATEEDVRKAGKTLEWKGERPNTTPPTAEPVGELTILIEKPDDANEALFPITIGEKKYAMASWICKRTAYTRVAKRVFTARAIELASCGLLGGVWSLASKDTVINGNSVKAPVLNLIGRNSEATIEAIKSLCGSK